MFVGKVSIRMRERETGREEEDEREAAVAYGLTTGGVILLSTVAGALSLCFWNEYILEHGNVPAYLPHERPSILAHERLQSLSSPLLVLASFEKLSCKAALKINSSRDQSKV